jgi:aminoglycoside phosphotransferase (APT) family kinase protein
MGTQRLDDARPVREGEALDLTALEAYLPGRLPGFAPPLEALQFPGGHSNLTYLLRAGGQEWVLRRPPFGAAIKTAHDMGREYRLLTGLEGRYPWAPRAYLYEEDPGLLGAPFYIMERRRGAILRSPAMVEKLGITPPQMRALCERLVDGLADLHAIDPDAAGLGGLGHPEGYVARQVSGWTGRYLAAKTDELAHLEEVAAWLSANRVPEVGASLIHGDYKYDNLVLHADDPTRIVALLDWEMATVGDPLMDLGTSLAYWVDPTDAEEVQMLPVGPTLAPGNLDRREVVERYAARSGRPVGNPVFYYVYGLFKVAVIAQQIYKRFRDGHTQDPRFGMMIVGVDLLGRQAARAIERDRIHDL